VNNLACHINITKAFNIIDWKSLFKVLHSVEVILNFSKLSVSENGRATSYLFFLNEELLTIYSILMKIYYIDIRQNLAL